MTVLSVDLGTSNTVAVLSQEGRLPRVVEVDGSSTMPSAVFAEHGELIVGREAERRARLDPASFEPNPKRRVDEGTLLLGTQVVPVTDALAAVLRRVGDEVRRQLGANPDEVRLTHPAQWGPVRRNTLLSAARQAKLGGELILVPEPVAAASHFASFPGQSLEPGQALAVYDLGAGTFDVAVVGATRQGFVVLAEGGLADLGGLDVDHALLEHISRQAAGRDPGRWADLMRPTRTEDRRAQRALREDVRVAKESLSNHPQTDVPLPEPFEDVLVSRAELESLIRPNLMRSVELMSSTVKAAGLTLDGLAGIYLVGGSSRIPLVATLISEQLHVVPTRLDQPETAVALGAHQLPKASLGLRTEDLAGTFSKASAAATTHMPSPPRPQPQQQPVPPPQQRPQVVSPQPTPVAPQPFYPQPQPMPQPMAWQQPPMPYGMPMRGPSNAMAYVTAGLFLVVSVLTLICGFINTDSSPEVDDSFVALVGFQFTEDVTGNGDFAISASLTVGFTVMLFAGLLLTRVGVFRWILVALGAALTISYVWGLIWVIDKNGEDYLSLLIICLVLWLAATIAAAIPPTGHAMRGYQRRFATAPGWR
ncbi:Hsp70 family protein [Labedaea rhizosphaerae]|uniref:Hsp70 protein n=1 Tax=Labedaea rhizosphaerae TaxID=598644 RepID=A0A4R6S9K1_LABRH|nr:Hsp70 family protein [Labedaea rhizosphaerae]TDP96027.1 Hsp70 protein [Labedaea rhizosphaerae]